MSWHPRDSEVRSSGWSRVPKDDEEEVDVGLVQSG